MSGPREKHDEPLTWEELERMYPRRELEVVPSEEKREEPPPFIHPDAFKTPRKIPQA